MAENITLNSISTFTNDTTAVNTYQSNNAVIVNAFSDVLSRSGVTPNQMGSTLDMNNNQIINLPPPTTTNSPARLIDVVSNPSLTIPNTGTSGHVVPFLDGTNTWSNPQTFSAADVFSVAPTFSTALSLPNGIVGRSNGSNVTAGNIGEVISNTILVGAAVPLSTTNTAFNVTSIALTAGDWDVSGIIYFLPNTTTNITSILASVSTASATNNAVAPFFGQHQYGSSGLVTGNVVTSVAIPTFRVNISSPATYYLVAQAGFTVSSITAFGSIYARRN